MVGESDASHSGGAAHLHRVLYGAVAPAPLCFVLRGRVLRVVNEEVGAREELDMASISLHRVAAACGQMA